MNRKFFVCSVGEPGKGYDEENLKRVIENRSFILHESTNQKGAYGKISQGDVLILKYRNKLTAYGLAQGNFQKAIDGWNLYSPVENWIFFDDLNPENGVGLYGIQGGTKSGGQYGTVKEVFQSFGLAKMKEIKSDSQLIEQIEEELIKNQEMKEIEEIESILKLKKQIILQGPPGTGKTRLAKEIAQDLTIRYQIEIEDIKKLILPGLVISSATKYSIYSILSINDSFVQIQLENEGSTYSISFKDIQRAFNIRLWKGGQKNGTDPYAAAIAKYIFENLEDEYVKLIQFHPAYSYDDFVRGITVDTSAGSVSYRAVNKVFTEMAQKALENYIDSKKSARQLSTEQVLDNYLDLFKDHLEEQININNGKFILDGTSIYLFQVEEDAVRYTGENWKQVTGQRLLFSDIKILFISGAKSYKDIKSNLHVSGLAKQHYSYFLRVLNLFKEFVSGKTFSDNQPMEVEEKTYILIIDEINRANLPSVLGELIYGLEYRGDQVESMYEVDGSRKLVVPPNFYIIGTMNTADRSVGHIDYAIRRRFAFIDVLPQMKPVHESARTYFEEVSSLFVKNFKKVIESDDVPIKAASLSPDFRPEDVWIGHSYFLTELKGSDAEQEIKIKMKYEVIPLLKEYMKDGILIEEQKVNEVISSLLR